jgi:hypothetical protein
MMLDRAKLELLSETKPYVVGDEDEAWFKWFHKGFEAAKKRKPRRPTGVPREFKSDWLNGWDSYED